MKNDIFDIEGKTAIVTGATGVLGGSISESLVKAGVKVVIMGRNQEKLDEKLESLSNLSHTKDQVMTFKCDILDVEKLKNVRRKVLESWGKIDILVNCAGGNIPEATLQESQSLFDLSLDGWNDVLDLNLNGSVYPSFVFGEAMAKQKEGNIINISSMATYSAITRVPGYSVAKSGLNIFTQWLAMEMALKYSDKIRVNAIAPGFFIGEQNRKVLINPDGSLTERSDKILARTPMKRFGDITELNGAVHFLCSDAASFITGAILPIDGGFSSFSGV
ncbi:MAG: SDR family oxidoreductase [Bacteroidales bacterium]|nr:SDR family oxidoreductase [Bacteroidales bacterium]